MVTHGTVETVTGGCKVSKAVLSTKVNPTYDDLPEQRYHFPQTYLRQVEAAVGDWIVYYEPRRENGRRTQPGISNRVISQRDQ